MTKFSVTKNGIQLDPSLYTWDEKTKTFSTNENYLVLDFSNINEITFKTGYSCTFKTGFSCTFDTGYSCTFKTGSYCTFKTGAWCTFKTASFCTFNTGCECNFKTGSKCVIVRRDIFEVIQLLEEKNYIKLNVRGIKGYIVLKSHTIIIDGKEVELSSDGYEQVKNLLK